MLTELFGGPGVSPGLVPLQLARKPTPIQPLPRLSERLGVDLRVKRDDLTGLAFSGNKIRKLEYLVADAMAKGADTLVTCGGAGSNHCRATAWVAAQFALGCRLILRTKDGLPPPQPWTGNLLLCRLAGAELRWVSRSQYRDYARCFGSEQEQLVAAGRNPYLIPEGGSNRLGSQGYVDCYAELHAQWPEADTVVSAMGSGGTAAGLVLGRRLVTQGPALAAVNVCDDAAFFRRRLTEILGDDASDHLQILDGFKGRGYGLSTAEELAFVAEMAALEGLLLDPVYTGKAFRGLVDTLRQDRHSLGTRVLFLHTGGAFGLFEQAKALGEVMM